MTAFILWSLFGSIIIGIGIYAFFSKKEVGFWANAKTFPIKDIKAYNHAVGKSFIFYGVILILLGAPLLGGSDSPYILLTLVGVLIETILLMIFYTIVIEKKYRS